MVSFWGPFYLHFKNKQQQYPVHVLELYSEILSFTTDRLLKWKYEVSDHLGNTTAHNLQFGNTRKPMLSF